MISHAIPGRIRLRHLAPLSPSGLAKLTSSIRNIVSSAAVNYNPQTCSTLILFDEKNKGAEVLALFLSEKKVSRPLCPPSLRWPHMRHIKRSMTVSLLAALGLILMRRERGHAIAGSIFLSLLSRHLWVYRKKLFK